MKEGFDVYIPVDLDNEQQKQLAANKQDAIFVTIGMDPGEFLLSCAKAATGDWEYAVLRSTSITDLIGDLLERIGPEQNGKIFQVEAQHIDLFKNLSDSLLSSAKRLDEAVELSRKNS